MAKDQGIRRRGQGENLKEAEDFEYGAAVRGGPEDIKSAPKQSFQFRALMNKNASLQWKQKGTNICQVQLLSVS
jgi:hypothetical protein